MLKTSTCLFFAVISIIGCAPAAVSTTPTTAPAPSPTVAEVAPAAPAVVEAPSDLVIPDAGGCSEPLPADDPRCPEEVLLAAALSFLDTTVARFDGMEVESVEYDPAEVLEEARQDPRFRQILASADAEPADGVLGAEEVRAAELQVLEIVEARYAALTQTR